MVSIYHERVLTITCMCGGRAGQAHGRQSKCLAGHEGAGWEMSRHALQRPRVVHALCDA